MALFTLLCALALSIGVVYGNPGGPPVGVCLTLMPSSTAPHKLQAGTGTYTVSTSIPPSSTLGWLAYTSGQTYGVKLEASGTTFRGFLMRSYDSSDTPIGTFVTTNSEQQLLNCSESSIPAGTTIAHNNTGLTNFTSQTFSWIAPSPGNGFVNFMFTIVRTMPQYYGPINAALNRPVTVTTPTRSIDDYMLILRSPPGCERSSCDIYVGISTNTGNDAYLDIYMEAAARAWVGVGFSTTNSMYDADVVACSIPDGTEIVKAVDTWNDGAVRNNFLDVVQDVSLFSGSFTNERLSCTLAKSITGSNVPINDMNLNADLWVMYGSANDRRPYGALAQHTRTPMITSSKINVVTLVSGSVTTAASINIGATPLVLALLAAIAVFVNKAY